MISYEKTYKDSSLLWHFLLNLVSVIMYYYKTCNSSTVSNFYMIPYVGK